MKNIHVLSTDKPSRLAIQLDCKPSYNLQLSKIADDWTKNWERQNIYITNDEEIKDGDWRLDVRFGTIYKSENPNSELYDNTFRKKIILTTDQDLIKDGVQAIDDEFLEWFIKNSSCSKIEVDSEIKWKSTVYDQPDIEHGIKYQIIIPKEEFKQRFEKYSERFDNDKSPIGNHETWGKRLVNETLEESIIRLTSDEQDIAKRLSGAYYITKGAKWQQERSYTKEQLLEALSESFGQGDMYRDEYKSRVMDKLGLDRFEQFKKK